MDGTTTDIPESLEHTKVTWSEKDTKVGHTYRGRRYLGSVFGRSEETETVVGDSLVGDDHSKLEVVTILWVGEEGQG